MLFVERTQSNLPLVLTPEIGRIAVEYSEYSRAVESSQAIFDDSDAVVINLSNVIEDSTATVSSSLSSQETELLLQSLSLEVTENLSSLNSSTMPLENYHLAHRLHRFPVYGSLIIDVYV